jgi:hypothetical protein
LGAFVAMEMEDIFGYGQGYKKEMKKFSVQMRTCI